MHDLIFITEMQTTVMHRQNALIVMSKVTSFVFKLIPVHYSQVSTTVQATLTTNMIS